METKMKLTVEAARELAPGRVLKCHVVRGLELHAGATGKTWKLYYRSADGVQRRPKIGTFPTLPIEAAREVAKDWHRRIAKGEDPSAARQAVRRAPTFDDLFVEYEREVIEKEYKPQTKVSARSAWSKYILPEFGSARVAEATVADVNRLLHRIGKRHHAMAANVRAYLSRGFQLAESSAYGWRPRGSNPCRDPECATFGVRRRKRHVRPDEFAGIHAELQKLSKESPYHVACIYAILYSGSRVTEMAKARRENVIADNRGARIVPADHKTAGHGVERTIWLPRQTVRLLASLPVDRNGYLFGPLGELAEPRRAVWDVWHAAAEAAGCPDLQVRDLRRTFASAAKSRGVGLDAIGDLFDHTSANTTKHYAFLFDDTSAALVQNVGDELERLLEGPTAAPSAGGADVPADPQTPASGQAAKV